VVAPLPTQDDPAYKQATRSRNPEARLRAFMHVCANKKECPYTSAPQPHYRLDGLKITAEFPKPKVDDDIMPDTIDRKQVPPWLLFLVAPVCQGLARVVLQQDGPLGQRAVVTPAGPCCARECCGGCLPPGFSFVSLSPCSPDGTSKADRNSLGALSSLARVV
jgi:hypothetical protein